MAVWHLVLAVPAVVAAFAAPTVQAQGNRRAVDDATIKAALDRSVGWLRQGSGATGAGNGVLTAMALLKVGVPASEPVVQQQINGILSRCTGGAYQPAEHHVYEAGVSLMALANADATGYLPQIKMIAEFLMAQQGPNGDWDYPQRGTGDTSITQYALLGLWEAARSGVDVPRKVWDQAASWHITTQLQDGSFVYHPPTEPGTFTMTVAGVASLLVARLHLYPDARDVEGLVRTGRRGPQKRFGVLEVDDADAPGDASRPAALYQVKTRLANIDRAVERGMKWLEQRFTVEPPLVQFSLYYLYGLERLAALADMPKIAGHDWYAEGAAFIVSLQMPDGTVRDRSQRQESSTCFAVLFLSRATAKMLHRERAPTFGTGLLAGGRGLPEDLKTVQVDRGQVHVRKPNGAIDELLSELENVQSRQIESAQAALVEQLVLGDPEKLIGQIDRLLKLVKDPRPDVRRTALWALGRSGRLQYAPLLISALEDADPACVVEARNGLLYLSQRLNDPELPDKPSDAQRAAAVVRWKKWYRSVRPFEERDDLTDISAAP